MEIDRQHAESVVGDAFEAHGISAPDAALTADVLVSADACGKHSHGVQRVPRYVRGIEAGNVDPGGTIDVVRERDGAATISGGSRLGPVVASEGTARAMDRAADHGIGAVAVRDGNHVGMLGYYTDQLRAAGFVGIAVTNAAPAMAPHGGTEPVLGTNPIAIGLPTDPPFNLDMATSSISRGAIHRLNERDEPLPDGVAVDAAGRPTTDPSEALAGAIRPFDGAKGSGLAVAVEVLAGGLAGAAMGEGVTGTFDTTTACTKGDLFLAIDPTALSDGFARRASAFLTDLQEQDPPEGAESVRVPGARSVERIRSATTVDVDATVWDDVTALAGE